MNEPKATARDALPDQRAQMRYATVLQIGTRSGLVLLIVSFSAYALGLVVPEVPLEELPRYWSMSVGDYVAATGQPTGWGWMKRIREADMFNLVGIALLSGWSLLCLASLLPLYSKGKDRIAVLLCVAQMAVLTLAASNLITV